MSNLRVGEPVELQTSYRSPLVQQALDELAGTMFKTGMELDHHSVKDFLRLKLAGQEREVFAVIFLDAQSHLIAYEELFYGTVTHTDVNVREVVKRALHYNAAAIALVHNHPSGNPEPSKEDIHLTKFMVLFMAKLDIAVVDHFIVGGNQDMRVTSLGELGAVA